ncbi:MAG TPA: parallel beta-helix domain-containing protein [Gaiellaceae bacterium]|nr:parallel beta-helix domain-containing protein [Gaiellaceae bacterium]
MRSTLLVFATLALVLGIAQPATAADVVVVSSIQAAVDAAAPGDTVLVPPARYHETVTIAKNGLTIRGSRGAVLDASGFSVGIRAAAGPGGPGCPTSTLTDLTIEGLRIENASFTGVLLRGVDGFDLRDGVYTGNEEYAIFPICSRDGVIDGNQVEGTDDAAIYVGNSHDVLVEHNHATDSTVGIEIENSTGIVVRGNTAIGNTSGIVTFVLPGLAVPVSEDVVIERNVVMHNNRPNPILPTEDVVGLIPTGTGILTAGADHVTVRENNVVGNNSGGIAVVALPIPNPDPRVDPLPDGDRVVGNVAFANGRSPDPLRSPYPGADLIYDGTGSGTCFSDNVFASSIPTTLELLFGCG